ncbi:ATP-binding protein [Actinokineospora terrae]|uniref:Tetratricopeptide repeat-containing protein n=1 Tax=Actinokineospora terrae TaxID=155974 RepID=A0A1H9VD11_9PSEU|nr:NB-ARC domain-containing protein [Actinokineospora terrae]SES19107.1 Tetratricopeptide repeat-containing protein [Actinokineospora terrae]
MGDDKPLGTSNEAGNTVTGSVVFGSVVQATGSIGSVTINQYHRAVTRPVPRQLPARPSGFVGRDRHLAELDAVLDGAAGAAMVVSTLGGTGGIGKTWLALAWAHRHLDRFPDGQLFTDLHGFSPEGRPKTPETAVRGFLDALGVDPGRVPPDPDSQAALYRSLVAGKRMLVLLDNAATADQVVALLPGSPTCTVLITGRRVLTSLIDRHGARHLAVGTLARAEARALLGARFGADRLDSESAAVDELIDLCAGFPLALSIIARTVTSRGGIPAAVVAAELRESGLDVLDNDTDPASSLPAVLSWSLRYLSAEQRTVFALVGIAPGTDTTPHAVASLARLSPAHARKALSALEEASLVDRQANGRYGMHDLVRHFAVATADTDLPDQVREAALARVLDFHLHTAYAADDLLDAHGNPLRPGPPAPGVHPIPLRDADSGMAWLAAEHATLLASARTAAALGRHLVVWHLAWVLETFNVRRGHSRDALALWLAALDAAENLADPALLLRAHRLLGRCYSRLGRHAEAIEHLDVALDLATRHGDLAEQAHTHETAALARGRLGDDGQALDHARQALALCRALGRSEWEADALNTAGWYAACLGDFDSARDQCAAALDRYRHHQDTAGEAAALDSLGFIAHRTGDHRGAVEHYDRALVLLRDIGHTYEVADALVSVGEAHLALGQTEQTRTAWDEAFDLYQRQERATDAASVQELLDNLGERPELDT